MKAREVIVEVLKVNLSGKQMWLSVSEPLSLQEAQERKQYHQKQYPENKYRLSSK